MGDDPRIGDQDRELEADPTVALTRPWRRPDPTPDDRWIRAELAAIEARALASGLIGAGLIPRRAEPTTTRPYQPTRVEWRELIGVECPCCRRAAWYLERERLVLDCEWFRGMHLLSLHPCDITLSPEDQDDMDWGWVE